MGCTVLLTLLFSITAWMPLSGHLRSLQHTTQSGSIMLGQRVWIGVTNYHMQVQTSIATSTLVFTLMTFIDTLWEVLFLLLRARDIQFSCLRLACAWPSKAPDRAVTVCLGLGPLLCFRLWEPTCNTPTQAHPYLCHQVYCLSWNQMLSKNHRNQTR